MASPTVMAAAAVAPQPPPALSDSRPADNSTAGVAATPRPVVPVTAVSKRTGLRPKPTPAPAAGGAPTPQAVTQAASVTAATASVDATAAGPPQLTIKLKQSVTKVADQSCHVPLDAALRPPIWINAASDVRHFFVVNGQAPMFLDVADAADTGVWNRIAKYNVRLLARDVPNDEPERLRKGFVVSGHLVLGPNLASFKVNFAKPGRDIGLVKRLFQFEVCLGLTADADLESDSADDVLIVRSRLFKVSTKPTRCMCVSTDGKAWTPRELIQRWPALGAQPKPANGATHNVRSRLGDVGEVNISYSNGAVTPPWGAMHRPAQPCRPGLAFEFRFCSPTRCLNFFADHRDKMLHAGLDLHLLPTRVWKNEFGIPEETTPPKVRRSRSGSGGVKRSRSGATSPSARSTASKKQGRTSPASATSRRSARRSTASRERAAAAAAAAPADAAVASAAAAAAAQQVDEPPALRRTLSDIPTQGPAKRRAVAYLSRSHSNESLTSLGRWAPYTSGGASAWNAQSPLKENPPRSASAGPGEWEVHGVIDLLAAAAELCSDGTPRKVLRPSPAKPASSVPGAGELNSPPVRRPLTMRRLLAPEDPLSPVFPSPQTSLHVIDAGHKRAAGYTKPRVAAQRALGVAATHPPLPARTSILDSLNFSPERATEA